MTTGARPATAGPGTNAGHPRKWLILGAVSLGIFMALLDATIVNIAIPAIIQDLHATVAQVADAFRWPYYAAAFTAALAIIPAFRTGRRLGEHAGYEELSRADRERVASKDRP